MQILHNNNTKAMVAIVVAGLLGRHL